MKSKKQPIDFKYNLKTYWSFLSKYKALFFTTVSIALFIEASYVVDKYLFKVIIDRGNEYATNILGINVFTRILLTVAAVFIILALLRVVSKWVYLHLVNRLETNIIVDLKQKYFKHILGLSHRFHTTHKTGSLIARLNRGAWSVERMTDFLIFNSFPLIFQLVIIGASLYYFEKLTALVVVLTAVSFIVYSLFIQKIQKKASMEFNTREDIEKANISDIFTNIESIKFYGKERIINKRFVNVSNKTKFALRKYYDYFRWFDAGHSLILALGTFFLIYFPLTRFLAGDITLGSLVFIYTVYGHLLGPLFGFVHDIRGFYRSMADFQDLFDYGKIENEIKDPENAQDLKIENGQIEFKDISFKYQNRNIIRGLDLKIKPGEKVALVGHSGSGKSTIVKLLYRFYDLQKGKILIDGKSIKDFKQESLRSELSIVPQECVLFDTSIYNNILFSNPKSTRKQVMQAMKFAQLDKIVSKFPNKENTIVGERGVKLSGGEKQRVSIARAILANKRVIILDEATSSLDSQTEHEIQKDLKRLLEGRTSIIIAHRLSTIMNADKIVVLDRGKIAQIGKHSELIKKPGLYKQLWSLQKGGYIE